MRNTIFAALLLAVGLVPMHVWGASPLVLLRQAHAHNDYLHARPLQDALDHGFRSIEADVFLVDGDLLVAHTEKELDPGRRLATLYLAPLRSRIRETGCGVDPNGPPLTLMIDVKSDAEATYARLHEMLAEYADILTTVSAGVVRPGPVTVVISGNRAANTLQSQDIRYAGLDGRLSDLDNDLPAHVMPMISDRWGGSFRWRGYGPMPDAERELLRAITAKAHEKNRRVRFWATPENEAVWQELLDGGVDLISTDDLSRLQQFLLKRQQAR